MPVMSAVEARFCSSGLWNRQVNRRVLPWLVGESAVEGHLLEVGAGAGAVAQLLLEQTPDLRLTAIDVDPAMVTRAARRLRPFGYRAHVELADAAALPPSLHAQFDLVLSLLMLHHTLDVPAVLEGAAAALRPGGRLLGYDLTRTQAAVWVHRMDRSPFGLATAKEMRGWLTSSAWSDVTITSHALGHVMRFSATRTSAAG